MLERKKNLIVLMQTLLLNMCIWQHGVEKFNRNCSRL